MIKRMQWVNLVGYEKSNIHLLPMRLADTKENILFVKQWEGEGGQWASFKDFDGRNAAPFSKIEILIDAQIKTLDQFNADDQPLGLYEFLQPFDEIDEQMYFHICCGYIPSHYEADGIVQGGDPGKKVGEAMTYATAIKMGDRYFYMGELPEFKQRKYDDE